MIGSVLVLFMLVFSLSFGLGIMLAHLLWSPPVQGVK